MLVIKITPIATPKTFRLFLEKVFLRLLGNFLNWKRSKWYRKNIPDIATKEKRA
jgi:hypothetical protein